MVPAATPAVHRRSGCPRLSEPRGSSITDRGSRLAADGPDGPGLHGSRVATDPDARRRPAAVRAPGRRRSRMGAGGLRAVASGGPGRPVLPQAAAPLTADRWLVGMDA